VEARVGPLRKAAKEEAAAKKAAIEGGFKCAPLPLPCHC
jgi:hypothetical protein